jgi:putative polyhydroxyalkanoate system protein|tara:strand:+ start:499 stop:774 length:276 start_codon:yes stop_codon:yes gene_type:complete
MSVITVSRPHTLEFDEIKAIAEEVVVKLSEEYGVKYHWENETVKFKGAGAKGKMMLSTSRVDLKMELSFLLTPFKTKIENSITRRLDDLLS